jgi:hypothetical protein
MPRDGVRFLEAEPQDPPTLVWMLSSGERLLLWAWRLWLEGTVHKDPARLERTWSGTIRMLGPERARRALDAMQALIYRSVRHARGEISYNPSCCRRVGPDEYRLLCLVAAAGAGETAAAEAHARALLAGGDGADLLTPARELAEALAEAGYALPHRPADPRHAAILRAAEEMATLDRSVAN